MNLNVLIDNVSMDFEKGLIKALKNVSFEVNNNEIFGLIGPDGAGKTTLFRIMTTLLIPTSGKVSIFGLDTVKDYLAIREFIGYVPGRFSLYQDLTVEENLKFFATIYRTTFKENYELIKDIYIHLEPFKKRKAGKLSGGMKQKLALCCALINKPRILFLDEPTTGIDPVSRIEFWQTIKKIKQMGITIIVATPYMDEANLCDSIAMIYNGEIFDIASPENFITKFSEKIYKIKSDNLSYLKNLLLNYEKNVNVYYFGDSIHLVTDKAINEDKLKEYLIKKDLKNIEISSINPSIEDCFIKYLSK